MAEWTFFTNHGLTLAAIAKSPRTTAREIGDAAGVTERAAHKIIKDLEDAGYVTKTKVGRKKPLSHPPGRAPEGRGYGRGSGRAAGHAGLAMAPPRKPAGHHGGGRRHGLGGRRTRPARGAAAIAACLGALP